MHQTVLWAEVVAHGRARAQTVYGDEIAHLYARKKLMFI
jgi:hypothetical protein